ncbi:bifunctional pantoate--beta-alanine ligase/(d)CMP kinase [Anabaena cylindrica FACHB-243]|uniref:Bifunctional pantoate ligase/cytidylate kinase n=1 Tax=Anabaena cylindrica (strain ATCC 27899 / PCC 7122) TaxID=272123 RepID=K9ZB14_ANACC|nr:MULTISPECIES: bifunctional pantoate--beta-alanine ligase/(d)CMP kinase [Anabaena]AFZ55772.1 Cytidylate kinase [Anabaena cylindrica PCC 7122]MBD2420227.1 bifunctional pantoate--beta-alanine ligase/(d)CMP kinase [Anabaena cylindrica FACHB-243]MBY5283098.1 bifunctional pantoate--beta-alanine ligase/(d)CMP kinase [Anabaena sp. CCAP 1446/1C]MBY5307815.1 bifunctional pantoate--beta-alanine ligase/(d)CMP kinase [Anabaena sp. CCAP 1446/1C]MCM2406121.1 bifunctional pantoate--beta-alanine ligase/(d)C
MRLLTTVAALRCYLTQRRRKAARLTPTESNLMLPEELLFDDQTTWYWTEVGLVPTMGGLHQGHLSLIERARQENSTVIVSIFVNPLQFGPKEDYQRYPRTLEQDQKLCEQAGVDAIFAPTPEEMGISQKNIQETPVTQVIPPSGMINSLCGSYRPGHFQGVATIVTKLFNLVQPDRAYFGQKDGQQLAIIKRLVADLNLPIEIVACPTVRETSGLALSSRNQYLTATEKEQATVLFKGLRQAEAAFRAGDRNSSQLIALVWQEIAKISTIYVEYIELVEPNTLMFLTKVEEEGMLAIAARLGSTRLIDNTILRDVYDELRQPIIAIDGPAGAGKSTVARQVATQLGLVYLDTGAMYRAITWLVLQKGVAIDDECAIAELANQCKIELTPSQTLQSPVQVWINGNDVTQEIRTIEVTSQVSAISAQNAVRKALVKQQQNWGKRGGLVAEGRDIGTHVFPDAEVKIFLTASVGERARRRQQDFTKQGQPEVSLEQLERDIAERDHKDSTRKISPLQKAVDAVEVQTDGLSPSEVAAQIVNYYQDRLSQR